MASSKQYFHDHVVLLLLSLQAFLAVAGSIFIILRLSSSHSTGYIVQYRSSLGIDRFEKGSVTELLAFIGFALLVMVIHSVLSKRTYAIHKNLSITILGMGILLLLLSIIVSNALLVLR